MNDLRCTRKQLFQNMLGWQASFVTRYTPETHSGQFLSYVSVIQSNCESLLSLQDCEAQIKSIRNSIPRKKKTIWSGNQYYGAILACNVALDIINSLQIRFPHEI